MNPGRVGSTAGRRARSRPSFASSWRRASRRSRTSAKVWGGQLCAKGTRVLVTVILDNLAEGLSREEILRSYPTLEPIHIDAALAYAAELAREESILPLRPA